MTFLRQPRANSQFFVPAGPKEADGEELEGVRRQDVNVTLSLPPPQLNVFVRIVKVQK